MPPFGGQCNTGGAGIGVLALLGGTVTYAGATLYEIGDAGDAARRFNERRRITVVPAAGASPGVTLVGRF